MPRGYVSTLLNSLPAEIKPPLQAIFDYLQDNWRLGSRVRATNAQWYRVTGTTSSNAGTEFSIVHGLDSPPTWLIPIVDLTAVGSQLVPLTVSKAPDASRVYLTSSSTGATFTAYLE